MKNTSKKTTETVAAATTNATSTTQPVAPLDVTELTPEQLRQLRDALRQQSKARSGDVDKRNALIDKDLHERDGDGFRWTTAEILQHLVDAQIVTIKTDDDRKAAIKMIQTRKQHLEGKGDKAVGYKPTPTGIGALTVERGIAFLTANGYAVTKA